MTVPFAFANLSGNIALSKLDSNFNTPITIGNTSVQLGNTVTTLNNLTLANVTITSGTSNVTNVNVTNINVVNVTATLANVTTLNATSAFITTGNIATANVGNLTLLNALTVPNGGTGMVTLPVNNVLLGNGTSPVASVVPGNVGNVLTSTGSIWISNAVPQLTNVAPNTASYILVSANGNLASGRVLTQGGNVTINDNGPGNTIVISATSGSPGGANTTIQFNNSGAFGGTSNLTFNGTTLNSASVNVSTGNLTFTTTGQKIVGDFSNLTVSSRTNFITGTANSTTGIYALPSGTANASSWQAANSSDPTNASKILISANGTVDVQLVSGVNGTGTYLPLSIVNGGAGRFVVGTAGQFGIGPIASVNYGTAGQPFLSSGPSAGPVYGTLGVGGGGTGLTTIPAGNVVIGNGTSALYGIAPGNVGNVLTSTGSAWVSSAGGGGTANATPLIESSTVIATSYTLIANKNAISLGATTISPGVSVTITSPDKWLVTSYSGIF